MKIKIKNLTSFAFSISFDFESEMKEDQRRWFQVEKSYLNSGCKDYIAKYKIPTDQENGTNSILWINLIPDRLYSKAELLSVKIRMAAKNMITEILHSIGCEPLGKIKPDPEWHTGHAEVSLMIRHQ